MHLKNEIATIVKEIEIQVTSYEDGMKKIFGFIDKAFEPSEFDFSRMTLKELSELIKKLKKC